MEVGAERFTEAKGKMVPQKSGGGEGCSAPKKSAATVEYAPFFTAYYISMKERRPPLSF